jgi:hypothetical protein
VNIIDGPLEGHFTAFISILLLSIDRLVVSLLLESGTDGYEGVMHLVGKCIQASIGVMSLGGFCGGEALSIGSSFHGEVSFR